jgi:hypothetical protein
MTDQETELQQQLSTIETSVRMLRINAPRISPEEINRELEHIASSVTALRTDVNEGSDIAFGSAGNLFPRE